MTHAIWTGRLAVGKEQIPVKLYSAVQDRSIHFHLLDKKTKTRVHQHMVNPETGKPVPAEEIQKGYEVEPGRFVLVGPKDLEKIEPEESGVIEVSRFLPQAAIMHQYYEHPYYLGPDGDDSGYFALAEALGNKEREGLAHWTMRKREYDGALRARDGYLVLITLRPAAEVATAQDLPEAKGRALDPREIKMAEQLVSALAGDFHPEEFQDEYRDRVMELIRSKAKGQKPKLQAVTKKKAPTSLVDMLAASLKRTKVA